jgi:putative ABC transport system permease protein
MDALAKSGIERTWITETVTMASAGESKPPMLVSVKAVDPQEISVLWRDSIVAPAPLSKALTADTVAVSDDVLLRLNLKVGDHPPGWPIVPHRRSGDL